MVWPTFRFKGYVECREMDALPPRLAVACAGIVAAIMYRDGLEDALPFDLAGASEADVWAARAALETHGWDAQVYGVPVPEVADALAAVAQDGAADDFDRESVRIFSELWGDRTVPKDHDLAQLQSPGR